jgi:hypothetical protein
MESSQKIAGLSHEQIRIRGRNRILPAAQIQGRTVVCSGRWLKLAFLKDENVVEGEPVDEPALFEAQLKASGLGADLLTFVQQPTESQPKHALYWEEDNLAVIRTDTFKDWWENRLPQESRKNVRRSAKRGVVVREVSFDDELVRGIKSIYDETPMRQGRRFWHYQKDFAAVKMENETYLDRSWFVGAYFNDELIGFIKVIMVDKLATLIQIIAKNAYRDKRPMNALLAYAVKQCEKRGVSFLVYGRYRYGKKQGDSLGEFKRRNGFEELVFPRYYVPLTWKGRVALKLGAQQGFESMIPRPLADFLLNVRARLMRLRSQPKYVDVSSGGHVPAEAAETN